METREELEQQVAYYMDEWRRTSKRAEEEQTIIRYHLSRKRKFLDALLIVDVVAKIIIALTLLFFLIPPAMSLY